MKTLSIKRFPELGYAGTEAINTLCTNLTFTGTKYKKIMVTSVMSAEGKTFLAMQILRTLSELGKRVVLVDAERNLIGVRGAVPGARGGLVLINEARKQ